jgi:hypothetical protein
MILIQIILECIPGADVKTESCNPHTEAGALWQQITRMTRCKCSDLSLGRCELTFLSKGILDVLLERRDGAIRTGLELCALSDFGARNEAVADQGFLQDAFDPRESLG